MGNPLVAQTQSSTTWYTGLGLIEDAAQISDGIKNDSWVDGTLGTVGGALDVLGMVIDPLGSLVAWGVSWLMEHVKPLKEALDWLAGNPDEISAHAQTWENVAKYVMDTQKYYADAIKAETASWIGPSGDAYRQHAGEHLNVMEGISKAAHGIHYAVMGAGLIVGLVRGIVRDLIAQFIGTLAARLPQWLAEAGLTLGLATPVVIGQVVSLVTTWVNKIQKFVRALLSSLKKLIPMVKKLGEILEKLKDLLKKLGRSGAGKHGDDLPTSTPKGPPKIDDPDFTPRPSERDRHGVLTDGTYRANAAGNKRHTYGEAPEGKSYFNEGTDVDQLSLDAAGYADQKGLWYGQNPGHPSDYANKAKVVYDQPVGVHGSTGQPTNVVNVYRKKNGTVHVTPGSPE
ncbi:hypothetical protein [Hamadaea sp.]|uniref:hypothetical protein n=1 Tax=Hamadaea sp. TaxID=2024425 RepID=UPI0025C55D0F|nr:hypothetical protein [Hamadaea sp.]